MKKIKVGVLGATGMVGQRYLSLLENHPWFEVTHLVASERSAGKTFQEAVHGRWHVDSPMLQTIASQKVYAVDDIAAAAKLCQFVFSALDTDIAKVYEEKYAAAGLPVVSNASAHRHTPDVPMLIPEINASHLEIIPHQQKKRGWDKGFIVVKPNCSLQSYLTPLYALHPTFKIKRAIITTLQAISGAGHPGVASFDIIDNVIPFISGEEEKSEREPLKIFGSIINGESVPTKDFTIAAHCNRVPVIDGHTACVSVEFEKKPTQKEILELWNNFRSTQQGLDLPSAPKAHILYCKEPDRPQPRLDRSSEKGMAVSVGRLRKCNVFDFRFVGLHHNTIRGAAGGGILNAELLVANDWIKH